MEEELERLLAGLLRSQRVAALGTLREGAPSVSMTPFAVSPDLRFFYIHVSRLAQHTADLLADPRVSLMVSEPDNGQRDPGTLARVSIQGQAIVLAEESHEAAAGRALYQERIPGALSRFTMKDFILVQIEVRSARFVAGFGRILDLDADHFMRASRH